LETIGVSSGEAGEVARSVRVIAMTAHSGSISRTVFEAGVGRFLVEAVEIHELKLFFPVRRTQSIKYQPRTGSASCPDANVRA
jgi:hypothetical protein